MNADAALSAIALTLKLAGLTTLILLVLGTPLAWWLARTQSPWKPAVSALVALPIVLPPTVIGFYLLVALGPNGPLGQLTQSLGLGTLPSRLPGWWSARCSTRCRLWCSRSRTRLRRLASARWKWQPPCELHRGTPF